MKILDAATAIRKVSALRALCLRLPHVPTPAELALLQRFGELVVAPESASTGDVEALAAGWRRWWYQGETTRLRAMAAHVPASLVQNDRRLALYACAAAAREAEMQDCLTASRFRWMLAASGEMRDIREDW